MTLNDLLSFLADQPLFFERTGIVANPVAARGQCTRSIALFATFNWKELPAVSIVGSQAIHASTLEID
jgi:hypothetical protein